MQTFFLVILPGIAPYAITAAVLGLVAALWLIPYARKTNAARKRASSQTHQAITYNLASSALINGLCLELEMNSALEDAMPTAMKARIYRLAGDARDYTPEEDS